MSAVAREVMFALGADAAGQQAGSTGQAVLCGKRVSVLNALNFQASDANH